MTNNNFLIERAFGAILYCLVIFIFLIAISRCKNFRNLKIAFIFYTITLTIMAFIYVPANSVDVTRWYALGNEWIKLSFSDFFKYEVLKSSTPVAYIYVYVCCATGIKGMLSGITALLFYSCTFYSLFIIFRSRKQIDFKNISLITFFTMCSGVFLSVIGGIRSALAFSIVLACFYKETIKSRGFVVDIFFLLIACFLHTAAFIVVAIRYFSLLIANKKIRTWLKTVLIVFLAVGAFVFLKDYLQEAFNKYQAYSSETVYFSGKAYISTIIIFAIELLIVLTFFANRKVRATVNYEQRVFLACFTVLELLLASNFVMLARFGIAYVFLLPLPLISLLEAKKTIALFKGRSFAFSFSFLCLFLNYVCGDLSAYKFIEL